MKRLVKNEVVRRWAENLIWLLGLAAAPILMYKIALFAGDATIVAAVMAVVTALLYLGATRFLLTLHLILKQINKKPQDYHHLRR